MVEADTGNAAADLLLQEEEDSYYDDEDETDEEVLDDADAEEDGWDGEGVALLDYDYAPQGEAGEVMADGGKAPLWEAGDMDMEVDYAAQEAGVAAFGAAEDEEAITAAHLETAAAAATAQSVHLYEDMEVDEVCPQYGHRPAAADFIEHIEHMQQQEQLGALYPADGFGPPGWGVDSSQHPVDDLEMDGEEPQQTGSRLLCTGQGTVLSPAVELPVAKSLEVDPAVARPTPISSSFVLSPAVELPVARSNEVDAAIARPTPLSSSFKKPHGSAAALRGHNNNQSRSSSPSVSSSNGSRCSVESDADHSDASSSRDPDWVEKRRYRDSSRERGSRSSRARGSSSSSRERRSSNSRDKGSSSSRERGSSSSGEGGGTSNSSRQNPKDSCRGGDREDVSRVAPGVIPLHSRDDLRNVLQVEKDYQLLQGYGGPMLEILQAVAPDILRLTWAAGGTKAGSKASICAVCFEVLPEPSSPKPDPRTIEADLQTLLEWRKGSQCALHAVQLSLGPAILELDSWDMPVPGRVLLVHQTRHFGNPFWYAVLYGLLAVKVVRGAPITKKELKDALAGKLAAWPYNSRRYPDPKTCESMLAMLVRASDQLCLS
jgi:hypothetical protein